MINKKGIKNLLLEDIKNSIILCDDMVNIDNVMCEYANEYKFFSPEAEKFVNENFEKESLKNKKIRKNTSIYGLVNFETYGTKIFLNYEKGDYKTSLATFNRGYKRYIRENNFFIIPIKVCSTLITKDNKIIISKNIDSKINGSLIDSFVLAEDLNGENINFLNTARRGIENKIGNIKLFNNKILGVFLSNCCVFSTFHNTDITSKEIIKNKEKDMFFIDNNEKSIKNTFLNYNLDNDSEISLKLHLKENFEVYETMMKKY